MGEQPNVVENVRDLNYLEQADAHADEGPLGNPAAVAILKLALKYARAYSALANAAQPTGANSAVEDDVYERATDAAIAHITPQVGEAELADWFNRVMVREITIVAIDTARNLIRGD